MCKNVHYTYLHRLCDIIIFEKIIKKLFVIVICVKSYVPDNLVVLEVYLDEMVSYIGLLRCNISWFEVCCEISVIVFGEHPVI